MQDFIPEGKEEVGTKSLFVDFIPTPTPKEIKDYDARAKARAEANKKKKERVVLTEQQIEEFKAMEEETVKETTINCDTPIEPVVEEEIGLPPEGGNGLPPEEIQEEVAEVEAEITPEIQVIPETKILPTPSKLKNKRNGKRR